MIFLKCIEISRPNAYAPLGGLHEHLLAPARRRVFTQPRPIATLATLLLARLDGAVNANTACAAPSCTNEATSFMPILRCARRDAALSWRTICISQRFCW